MYFQDPTVRRQESQGLYGMICLHFTEIKLSRPSMCYPWFWSSWWCIDDGVLRLFIRTFSWEKLLSSLSRNLIFEGGSQTANTFAYENDLFSQAALSQGARSSHCVELLGCKLFLKQGKRWILDASRREYSRRMRWHSNGYPSTGFPDILGSFLSK